jgi:hypothetical protein
MKTQWLRLIVTNLLLIVAVVGSASAQHGGSSPVIPPGIEIQVRMIDNLSSERTNTGDTFQGTLEAPLVVQGRVLYTKGSNVTGQVSAAHRSGRLSDPGVLELVLTSVSDSRKSSALATEIFPIKGASHTKSNVGKIGGGAAAGAIIGAIVGGGKGAAIGAGVGAGAGTATAAASGKRPATVESEAVLIFVSSSGSNEIVARPPDNGGEHYAEAPADGDGGHYVEAPADSDNDHHVRRRHSSDHDDDDDDQGRNHRYFDSDRDSDSRNSFSFGERDREILQGCLSDYDFESLPPGIQKKLARGGTLPPGHAKRMHALPSNCTARLPRLHRGMSRIIFGNRVILIDDSDQILDILIFER